MWNDKRANRGGATGPIIVACVTGVCFGIVLALSFSNYATISSGVKRTIDSLIPFSNGVPGIMSEAYLAELTTNITAAEEACAEILMIDSHPTKVTFRPAWLSDPTLREVHFAFNRDESGYPLSLEREGGQVYGNANMGYTGVSFIDDLIHSDDPQVPVVLSRINKMYAQQRGLIPRFETLDEYLLATNRSRKIVKSTAAEQYLYNLPLYNIPDASRTNESERDKIASTTHILNDMTQMVLQQECVSSALGGISTSGGWCNKKDMSYHRFDTQLAEGMCDFFKNSTLNIFGDGPALYTRYMRNNCTEPIQVKAYDGAPYTEYMTDGRADFLDLTIYHSGRPIADWVMSLEVVEHIPREFEDAFLTNAIKHARHGIILSWAVPRQVGHGHVNLRTAKYVFEKLASLGFDVDWNLTNTFKSYCRYQWLKDNSYAYVRRTPLTTEELEANNYWGGGAYEIDEVKK